MGPIGRRRGGLFNGSPEEIADAVRKWEMQSVLDGEANAMKLPDHVVDKVARRIRVSRPCGNTYPCERCNKEGDGWQGCHLLAMDAINEMFDLPAEYFKPAAHHVWGDQAGLEIAWHTVIDKILAGAPKRVP